jgi:O-antigen/teichoic acid export membrane protein
MPLISKTDDKNLRIKYTKRSLQIVLLTGILGYILLFFFGEILLKLLFTEKYVLSYPILLVVAIGGIFSSLRNIFCALWEGMGSPIISTYDIVVASIVCILTSYLLIPLMGAIGAAYAYVFGIGMAVVIDLIFWIRYTK